MGLKSKEKNKQNNCLQENVSSYNFSFIENMNTFVFLNVMSSKKYTQIWGLIFT